MNSRGLIVTILLLTSFITACGSQDFSHLFSNSSNSNLGNQTPPPGGDGTPTIPPGSVPVPPGVDKWVLLSQDPVAGPYQPYFYCPVVRQKTGEILLGWSRTFIFSDSQGWTVANNTPAGTDPTADIGRRENYGCDYDADRDVAWIGDGAPVAYGAVQGAQSGELTFNFANKLWSLVFPNFGNQATSISSADGAFVYTKNKLWKFGSFSIGPAQGTASHDLTTGVITKFPTASYTHPQWTGANGYSRVVYARSGVLDKNQEILWTLADNNELWLRDPVSGNWNLTATTGDKPTSNHIVADFDPEHKVIVAWAGNDGVVMADNGAPIGGTWILDTTTFVWRKSLMRSAGYPVPSTMPLASNMIRYDGFNHRMIMTIGRGGTEVWAFKLGNPPP